ncbi:cellulase-like family protein [Sphingobium algorifonticola]|uniref:Cellulase n=1 Tax=Sphingobium algorifonticola TaxID=2008318 RepID=A0A437J481_9SPHN|nr:cellulase-like family protein [Sphingobium algorifonticola]RVT39439.1 hypothetical protein ENE74_15465 [Sphingobium algorifonticola]
MLSRREMFGIGAAAAISAVGTRGQAAPAQDGPEFPNQVASQARSAKRSGKAPLRSGFDMRDGLSPRRLTMAMWDQSFVLRHGPGGSFADFDRVLKETEDRRYNVVRIDPMPQYVDLKNTAQVHDWPDRGLPFVPWSPPPGAQKTPTARWIIDFMEKLLGRSTLHYTLSAWWFGWRGTHLKATRTPENTMQAAEMWAVMLRDWQRLFGFDRLLYVDVVNEFPFFAPYVQSRFEKETGGGWGNGAFTPTQVEWLIREINPALAALRGEFPQLRFNLSIHGDERWLDVPVEHDCLDVHFYADADPRWDARTRFGARSADFFKSDRAYKDFSTRAIQASKVMAPMFRARQRAKLSNFAAMAEQRGMPLTTTESWASWFYIDHPDLDWGWLLEWASWTVDDAIDFGMWGWTPHNYVQPQFPNWRDVRWHRALNERFLAS